MLSDTERSTADLYTEAAQMTDTYSCYKYFPMPNEEVTHFSANISNYAVRGYYLNSDNPLVMMCDNYWPLDRNDKPFGGGVDKPSNNPFKEMVERVIPYSNEANATRIALEDAQFGQLIPDPNLARFRVTTPKAATHLFLEFGFEYSYPEGTSELARAVENYRKLYHGVASIGKRSLDSHETTFYIITSIDTLPAFSVHFTFAGSETTIANTRPREDIAAQYREDWRKLQIEENYQRMLRHHEQKVENAEYTAEDYEIDQLKARLDQWFTEHEAFLSHQMINPAIRDFVVHYPFDIPYKKFIALSVILHSIGKTCSMRR